jgi:hypothetical protein
MGAAISTLLAYSIMFTALFILNRKWLPISFNYGRIIFLLGICMIGFYYLQVEPNKHWCRFILSVIIISVGFPLLKAPIKIRHKIY